MWREVVGIPYSQDKTTTGSKEIAIVDDWKGCRRYYDLAGIKE